MSIFDLEKTSTENNETNSTSISISKKEITFDDIEKKFENDFWLRSSLGILKELKNSLNDKNSTEVRKILLSLYKTENYDKINEYIWELKVIAEKYEAGKAETVETAKKQQKQVKGKEWNDYNQLLDKILDVSIDWEISYEYFENWLEDYKNEIKKTDEFKKLSLKEQTIFLNNIDWIKKPFKEWLEVQLNNLNKYYDSLAKQVDKQWNWKISLTLQNWKKLSFENKEIAYKFILKNKEVAELKLQTLSRTFVEWFFNYSWKLLHLWWVIVTRPIVWSYELLQNWDLDSLWWIASYIWWVLLAYASTNMTLSIIKATNAKIIASEFPILNRLAVWEYLQESDPRTLEASGGKESIQLTRRKNIQKILEAVYKWNPEKEKLLKDAREYINVLDHNLDDSDKDSTDEKIKNKLRYPEWIYWDKIGQIMWMWNFHDKYNPTKNKYIDILLKPLLLNKRSKIIAKVESGDFRSDIETKIIHPLKEYFKWVSFDYKNSIVTFNENEYKNAKWEKIKSIEAYIDTLNIGSGEKEKIKSRVNRYFENIFTNWRIETEIDIAKNLDKYINHNIIDFNEFKEILLENKDLKELFKWVISDWEYERKFEDIIKWETKISKANYIILNNKKIALKRLIELFKNWELEVTERELREIIKDDVLDSNKIDLLSKKIKKTKINGDYKEWKKIINEWKNIIENIKKAKEILTWNIWEKLNIIFSLDNSNFPSEESRIYWDLGKEDYFKKMYEDLEKKSQKDDFKLTQDQVKLEIVKMKNWYLSNDKVISILNKSLIGDELKQDNVKDYIEKVETWKMVVTLDEVNQDIIDLKNWNTIAERVRTFDISDEIEKIENEWKKLAEIDFKNEDFWVFDKDWKLKTNEIEKIIKFSELLQFNKNTNIEKNTNSLLRKINNWTDYTSVEFFNELNSKLEISITIDENTTLTKYIKTVGEKLENYFDSLSEVEKKSFIEKFKNKNIEEKDIPKKIKDYIDNEINEEEKIKQQEKEIKAKEKHKTALKNKIEQIKSRRNINQLEKLETEFNSYLDNPSNNINRSEYNNLIEEFEVEYNKKYDELDHTENSKKKKKWNEFEKLFKSPEEINKQKIIDLATNNPQEYQKLVAITSEKLELRAILDWKKASDVSFNWVDDILKTEFNSEFNENLIKDFVEKANISWIDYNAVKEWLVESWKKAYITRQINKSWKTELKDFWEKAKKLWKDFFKEVKKGK